jgi:hypothetical protein
MAGFAKFDPQAFLESERRAAANAGLARTLKDAPRPMNKPRTLADLATLASPFSRNENKDFGQSSATADHHHHGENRQSESAAAKVAKVAKVEPSVAAIGDPPWGETEDERAAIIEYGGGALRAWAEALARLNPAYPPCDIAPNRWLQFIDDCGRFVDDGWAAYAERLGWTPLDLFGCDRAKPFARINRAGLLWLLNGRKLLALAAETAAIATASGGHLTFRRCIREPGGVPAWELPREADAQ